jgi:hypothetical protein
MSVKKENFCHTWQQTEASRKEGALATQRNIVQKKEKYGVKKKQTTREMTEIFQNLKKSN